MDYKYKTKMVCSQEIRFNIEGNVITNVSFIGGCNGNLKAISKLVDGMTVEEIEAKIAQRAEAKKAKDFETADAIRAELEGKGIILNDTREGTVWDFKALYNVQ